MGLKDLFFGNAQDRKRQQRERHGQRLNHRNTLHDDRMQSLQALTQDASDEAATWLLRRFDWVTDKQNEDQLEKEYVAQALENELRPVAPAALRRFLLESENVSLAIQSYLRIAPEDEVVGAVLDALDREVQKDSFKPAKKTRLLDALRGHPHARTTASVTPLLQDYDDQVRHTAVEVLLEQQDDAVPDALIQAAVRPDEESQRVRGRLLRALAERGWSVGERRSEVERVLEKGMSLDPQGRVRIA